MCRTKFQEPLYVFKGDGVHIILLWKMLQNWHVEPQQFKYPVEQITQYREGLCFMWELHCCNMKTKTSWVMARSWPALCVVDVVVTPGRIHEQDKNGFKSCLHQGREHSVQNLSPERLELAIPQHEHACISPCLAGTDLPLDDREPWCSILPYCFLSFKYCYRFLLGSPFLIPT